MVVFEHVRGSMVLGPTNEKVPSASNLFHRSAPGSPFAC